MQQLLSVLGEISAHIHWRSRPRSQQILGGCGILLGVCVILGMVGAALDSTEDASTPTRSALILAVTRTATHAASVTPTPRPSETPTPLPTETAAPTATPTPPSTATPESTATPLPSPTPVPTSTPTAIPTPTATAVPGGAQAPITFAVSTVGEIVRITNNTADPLDVGGWTVVSVKGDQRYVIPVGTVIAPDATLTIASGGKDGDLLWTTKNIWNNDGDPGQLLDAAGNLVAQS